MAAALGWWRGQHDFVSLFLFVRQWSTGWKALVDIPVPASKCDKISCHTLSSPFLKQHKGFSSLSSSHLRSEVISIITTAEPHLACYNWGTGSMQRSWQGGEESPGRCVRKEDHHRRAVADPRCITPSDDECLKMWKNCFGKPHPSGRKSGTGMAISASW